MNSDIKITKHNKLNVSLTKDLVGRSLLNFDNLKHLTDIKEDLNLQLILYFAVNEIIV